MDFTYLIRLEKAYIILKYLLAGTFDDLIFIFSIPIMPIHHSNNIMHKFGQNVPTKPLSGTMYLQDNLAEFAYSEGLERGPPSAPAEICDIISERDINVKYQRMAIYYIFIFRLLEDTWKGGV